MFLARELKKTRSTVDGLPLRLYSARRTVTLNRDLSMIFRQLHEADSNALSYLIADPITRATAIIDGVQGRGEQYLATMRQLDLELVYVLETHVHEDHESVAPWLRKMTAARLAMHERANVPCTDLHLRDGDLVHLGEETIEAIYTPGHSACSITYRWRDRLFTGGTLLAGRVGSCNGAAGDPGALYDSVHERLYAQPGEFLVYPSLEVDARRVSSIEQERLSNRDLPYSITREEFLAGRRAPSSVMNRPGMDYIQINRGCPGIVAA